MTGLDDVEAVARAAVLAGGAELRDRSRNGDAAGDYGGTDVKAAADEAAEARMLPVVRRAFPSVFAEEAGHFEGTGRYRWVIDSWAPTVHSGVFTRGRIQGLVQFHPNEEERAVTELLAPESGAAVRREGPVSVAACGEAPVNYPTLLAHG